MKESKEVQDLLRVQNLIKSARRHMAFAVESALLGENVEMTVAFVRRQLAAALDDLDPTQAEDAAVEERTIVDPDCRMTSGYCYWSVGDEIYRHDNGILYDFSDDSGTSNFLGVCTRVEFDGNRTAKVYYMPVKGAI